jgi:ribosomal protein L34E
MAKRMHKCERCGVPLEYADLKKLQFLEMKQNSKNKDELIPKLIYNENLCGKCQLEVFGIFCVAMDRKNREV